MTNHPAPANAKHIQSIDGTYGANNEGGNEMNKPVVKLVGTDGNVFSIIGKVSKALTNNGQSDMAKRFTEEAFKCEAYHDVIKLATDYVDIE